MVVIRCNALIDNRQAHHLITDIHDQARDGVVVVPNFCEVLAVDNDGELQIIQEEKESERVAELERELAAALDYIRLSKSCSGCKHDMPAHLALYCMDDCQDCIGEVCKGKCKTCINCSNWEWRGAHEPV